MPLGKAMNPFILSAMGKIVPLLFFYKDSFGLKYPTKVDILLIKENYLSESLHMYVSMNLSVCFIFRISS